MREPLLDKLDRKIGKFAPKYLLTIILIGTAIVWLLDYMVYWRTGVWISNYLYFNKAAILQGQVWRLVTFLFVSMEANNIFFLAISLYFYWLIGTALEGAWGTFKFDIFYIFGILCAIGSGFITGYATLEYLNLSLFLAFAILCPDYQVLLFFFIPVKVKWLAIVDLIGIVLILIFVGWAERIAIFVSLFNVALFVIGNVIRRIAAWRRKKKWQQGLCVVEEKDNERKKEKPRREKKQKQDKDDNGPFIL